MRGFRGLDKILESEDRLMRGGRSPVDRVTLATARWCDLVGSAIGQSARDAWCVGAAINTGSRISSCFWEACWDRVDAWGSLTMLLKFCESEPVLDGICERGGFPVLEKRLSIIDANGEMTIRVE